MPDPIRLLIADDHAVLRDSLCALLETKADIEVVGQAANGLEAMEQTRRLHPDVILLDLMMPRQDGLETIRQIKAENPDAKILVLTSYSEDAKVFAAIKLGALGYMLKDAPASELLQAIRAVSQGESSLHPAIAHKLIQELNAPAAPTEPAVPKLLSERELEVLELIAQGLPNQQISQQLSISEHTVRNHVSNILAKLHVSNRTQAARYALQKQ